MFDFTLAKISTYTESFSQSIQSRAQIEDSCSEDQQMLITQWTLGIYCTTVQGMWHKQARLNSLTHTNTQKEKAETVSLNQVSMKYLWTTNTVIHTSTSTLIVFIQKMIQELCGIISHASLFYLSSISTQKYEVLINDWHK